MTSNQPSWQPRPVVVPPRGSQSAARAGAILDLLAERQVPMTLTEIAVSLMLAKSSTLAVLVSLEDAGLVRRGDTGYELDLGVVRLATSFLDGVDVVNQFKSLVLHYPGLSQEIVHLSVLSGREVTYVARYTGRASLPSTARVGDCFPASLASAGTALLTELDDDAIRRLFDAKDAFPRWTSTSTKSITALLAKVHKARRLGYAVDDGETHSDAVGYAVCVRHHGPHQQDFGLGYSFRRLSQPEATAGQLIDELRSLRADLEAATLIV